MKLPKLKTTIDREILAVDWQQKNVTVLVRDRAGNYRKARTIVTGFAGDVGPYLLIDAEKKGDQ